MMELDYVSGYIERNKEGKYDGLLKVEGIDLSPIQAIMFNEGGKTYLWIKRKDVLEYDFETTRYIRRKREPRFEAYLEKIIDGNAVAYKGEFLFLRFRFSIVGVWDTVDGFDKGRLNLYVERLPQERQEIINALRNTKNEKH